ncbi:MAG: aldo/keto reductase [Verrucomicrobia bacterium]|nr:aldo/keto reductase [Verrucomicrobiota bacterium]
MPDLPFARLGFGTPALMGCETRAERLALLEAAASAGITHFDTSPYYGYGVVEPLLGEFLAAHGGNFTVTTKFGIQPPPALARGSFIMGFARRLAALSPGLKRLLSRGASKMVAHGAFDPVSAERSLLASLRQLRRERVDFFLLHEPHLDDTRRPGLLDFLRTAKADGRVGAFGVGATGERAETIAQQEPAFADFLQFESDPAGARVARCTAPGRLISTFGGVGQALPVLIQRLAEPGAQPLAKDLDVDPRDRERLATLLLVLALVNNPHGLVLFATRNPARIRAHVAAAQDPALFATAAKIGALLQSQTAP